MASRMFRFVGGDTGSWQIVGMDRIAGAPLEQARRLAIFEADLATPQAGSKWCLRGVTSYERYVTRHEHDLLAAAQPALGRPAANCAALIPIKKTEAWWQLPQDERRAI